MNLQLSNLLTEGSFHKRCLANFSKYFRTGIFRKSREERFRKTGFTIGRSSFNMSKVLE